MAHRLITRVLFIGARVLGRAAVEAYRHASATSAYERAAGASGTAAGKIFSASTMTLEEASKILNVPVPRGGKADMEEVMERFKKLFDANEPSRGGSFYLQSKVLRARERIQAEVAEATEATKEAEELRRGWNPKLFKD